MRFVHDTLPQRVRFASGEAAGQLAEEVRERGYSRLMVIATESQKALAERILGELPVAVWHHEVAMHVPAGLATRGREVAAAHHVDVLVAVGGGSTTGLAKAIALTTGLPIIAVPTTYAGSEATSVWGLTEAGRKTTGMDERVLPQTVVYDASLMLTLPVAMSVASGLNALAHSIDAMWAPRANPISAALAGEGIRALNAGLPKVAADPTGLTGREHALYGAYLSAVAFASAGSGLHHKICHVLGGMLDLPHAQTHAVVLPHVLAFNGPAAPDAEQRIAAAFEAPSANRGLATLRSTLDAPTALRDYGMTEDVIAPVVEAVLAAVPAGNPAPVTAENLTALLRAAWEGDLPR
ncbi:maleylacetate reductase [Amycolatopsis taiwanensis]|uniref:maleylacetate reductase n=1 Tax=Amycolatopsis taiwanensis TaxID=342230 RepID=UPI000481599D|nr:maleylacetate reductase [Amycolatopsis taiwanensis]